jgi:hypothetical protein
MGSVIIGILTDMNMRSDQAVESGLMSYAETGLAWGHVAE